MNVYKITDFDVYLFGIYKQYYTFLIKIFVRIVYIIKKFIYFKSLYPSILELELLVQFLETILNIWQCDTSVSLSSYKSKSKEREQMCHFKS